MKRFLFFATCASLTLASCVNDEKLEELSESKSLISFSSPVVGANSRVIAGEMSNPFNTDETFQVFGLMHEKTGYAGTGWDNADKLLIKDETVVYNPTLNAWITKDKTYFWPKDKNMTFGAYSPTQVKTAVASNSGTITYNETGLNITGFEVDPDPENQYDLMYSEVAKNKTTSPSSATGGYNGVDINFHHALSSINFYVKLDPSVTSGSIKNLKINNVKYQGNFSQNVVWNSETLSTTTLGTASWTRTDAKHSYTVYTDEVEAQTATNTKVGPNLILLPQPFADNTEASVTLEYKMANNPWVSETIYLKDLTPGGWIMSKRYNYTIIIGGSGVTATYFAPNVTDWFNEDDEILLP